MSRNCAVCGRTYTAKDPRSKYCGDACRQRHARGTPVCKNPMTKRVGGDALNGRPAPRDDLVVAVMTALESAGKLDSVQGQLAMTLAIVVAAGGDTASGLASLSKELRAVMAEALGNAKAGGDEMDMLKTKRQAKRAG